MELKPGRAPPLEHHDKGSQTLLDLLYFCDSSTWHQKTTTSPSIIRGMEYIPLSQSLGHQAVQLCQLLTKQKFLYVSIENQNSWKNPTLIHRCYKQVHYCNAPSFLLSSSPFFDLVLIRYKNFSSSFDMQMHNVAIDQRSLLALFTH